MTLEQGYFISQIIAAIVLIASVLFLALQVRQNSRLLSQTMIEEYRKNSTAVFTKVADSREYAKFFMKVGSNYDELDDIDRCRAEYNALHGIITMAHTIRSRQSGFIADPEWEEMLARLRFTTKRKNWQTVWPRVRDSYPKYIQDVWDEAANS